ncbi:MAG: DNA recombination protein RmuC, partial [Pseudomonadales bacterium]|jgi:DNA recombination protein RmuC|nr:DNA recombination protein RmuC [Pseudomonadales bacterium]
MGPLREQLGEFKARVEQVYHADIKERATLLGEVKNLQQASERINAEAENLTRALKGDKKLQGNWGELVLERVLESSGLRKDHEYFVQSSERNQAGDLKRPDVVVRLPEQRDVVVDAKVSLNAYEQAHTESDEQNRDRLLRTHANNLRNHVKRLSEQDYDQLPNVRSLDFVLLFVPIESAFASAMKTDERLFNEAFNQRIVIVSPTTLMMTLRIINNVWRIEKQGDNAQEIAERAGALYDKLRLLVDDLETLGRQLQTVERTFDVLHGRLVSGKGNLVRQVEQLRELGAVVKKPISAKLLDSLPEEE